MSKTKKNHTGWNPDFSGDFCVVGPQRKTFWSTTFRCHNSLSYRPFKTTGHKQGYMDAGGRIVEAGYGEFGFALKIYIFAVTWVLPRALPKSSSTDSSDGSCALASSSDSPRNLSPRLTGCGSIHSGEFDRNYPEGVMNRGVTPPSMK